LECDVLFLGFGPITHAFAKKLITKGHKVIVVSENSIEGTNARFPRDLFHTMKWTEVIHNQIVSESTYIGWRQSPHNRVLGPELINWVKSLEMKTEKIHHLSSASVYTGEKLFFSETDYNPRSSNSLNPKQKLERLVLEISSEKQTKFVNYRIANVYGSSLNYGFINESLNKIRDDLPIRNYNKLDVVRDYLLIDDLVAALLDLRLFEYSDEILNISTGHGVSISQVIAHFKSSSIKNIKLLEVEVPVKTILRSVLSCKKLEETISWKPQLLFKALDTLMQYEIQGVPRPH
jgi:nucleoside-diphosphate-sugar epimerase